MWIVVIMNTLIGFVNSQEKLSEQGAVSDFLKNDHVENSKSNIKVT